MNTKSTIKYLLTASIITLWSCLSMAGTTLYSNDFKGKLSYGVNELPSSVQGLVNINFFPPPAEYPADCLFLQGFGSFSSACIVNHNPPAGIPGNIYAVLPTPLFGLADPNLPTVPKEFTTNDPILTFEVKLSYYHPLNSKASIQQANYYGTDVYDLRLGATFVAITSPNSPATLCYYVTSNEIIAFVDGFSQSSSSDTGPGYSFISMKKLVDYVPGTMVSIKVRIDKVNQTGTYLVNNVPKLVVNLDGKLPADGLTITLKTDNIQKNRASGLDGWSLALVPVQAHMDLASFGSAPGRYTAGGLVDLQLAPLFFGANQIDPLALAASKPFNDWVDNYAFGTTHLTIVDNIKVTSDGL